VWDNNILLINKPISNKISYKMVAQKSKYYKERLENSCKSRLHRKFVMKYYIETRQTEKLSWKSRLYRK
jgi:hypothetical protein